MKIKRQIHQKTVKTLDPIKSLTRKFNKNFGPHKSFEIKNKNKGENCENSSPHQNFEKKSINAKENSENGSPHTNFEKKNY